VAFLLVWTSFRIWLRFVVDVDDRRTEPVPVSGMASTHPFADTVAVATLAPGTCVDRVPIFSARPVPCSQSHLAEIVAQFPRPSASTPIVDVYRQSLDRCQTEFAAYTGTRPDQASARFFVTLPFSGAEQVVICYASGRSGEQLTGSVRAR